MMNYRNQNTRFVLLLAAIAILILPGLHARTWTSADGAKTFEGELKSYKAATGMVTVTVPNGQSLTFLQDRLSEADITFLKEKGDVTPAPVGSRRNSLGSVKTTGELPDPLPDPDGEDADMSKPVQVYILLGQSNMLGLGNMASLENAVKTKDKYPYLVDEAGDWTQRKDVRNVFMMTFKLQHNDWMSVSNRKNVGPDYGIGHYLGYATDAPVMILKSCIGNRSLGWDLLPPGSEPYEAGGKTIPGYRGTPGDPKGNGEKVEGEWYAGKQYDDDTEAARLVELDAYWSEVSRTVREGDFEGYRATCHPEAVLVSGKSQTSYPLSEALARWQAEFDATKAGTIKADVEFRFSQRFGDATTAHETGIFRYSATNAKGETKTEFVNFQALLVKKPEGWKILMEYQKSSAEKSDWEALGEN